MMRKCEENKEEKKEGNLTIKITIFVAK